MESKTPEELAVIATNKSKYYQYPAGSYSAHTVETAFFDGFLAGYAAALPKWYAPEEKLPNKNGFVLADFIDHHGIWATTVVCYNLTGSEEVPSGFYYKGVIIVPRLWTCLPALPTKEP